MDDESSPTHVAPDPTGQLIGDRYRISRLIATGGMARVFQANDEVLQRPVAVKILHAHLVNDAAFVERFRHEAISAARLSHPSIVSIYDTVSDNGVEAIVMELVHGTTLRRRLDVVTLLPVEQTVAVGAQVADALETAHRGGVIHRDIKPANILLSTDGRVLVADFGIAKAAQGADLTAAGSMLGTAKYLAPEQVEGTPVDGRTDVYALGIVLYECLCGRVPFLADTDTGTALARIHQAPLRPRQVRADIPRPIEDVILRAMARHPGDRFGDAAQLRAALLGCVRGKPGIAVTADDTDQIRRDTTAIVDDHTPIPPAPLAETVEDDVDRPGFGASERAWLVPTLLILLVAVALGVVGVLFGTSDTGHQILGSSNDNTTTTVLAPIGVQSVHAFDPAPGDGKEDNDGLANLIDGDPTTVWHTETYDAAPLFGVKDGVGFTLRLNREAPLNKITIDTSSSGWDAEIFVSKGTPGNSLAAWGKPIAKRTNIPTGTVMLPLHGTRGSSVLVWITRLSASGRVTISRVAVQ